MKRKLFKSMWLAMLLVAFAGCGTEKKFRITADGFA